MNKMMITIDYDISIFYIIFQLILKPIIKSKAIKALIITMFFICIFNSEVKTDVDNCYVTYQIAQKQYSWLYKGLYDIIYYRSVKNKLDPLLVCSLINAESSGYKYAVSCANAKGYMQLMPVHTKGKDPFNTNTNIILGTNYLKKCINKSKYKYKLDIYDSLRMYNQGMNGKRKKYKNWKYVRKIMRHYKVMIASNGGSI